jgi:hypothetical protein
VHQPRQKAFSAARLPLDQDRRKTARTSVMLQQGSRLLPERDGFPAFAQELV